MDLLRLDTIEYGPIYVPAGSIVCLAKNEENTNCGIALAAGRNMDVTLAGDPDEVAQAIEQAYHGCRIHRVI